MKGQVSIVEAIIASIALFVSFNMLLPDPEYQTKWGDANLLLNGRDILIASDRLDKLHDYVFSQNNFNTFLSKLNIFEDVIIKTDTQGAIKSTTYVACDCTDDQVTYLQSILSNVKFNKRNVNFIVCKTTLPTISSCTPGRKYPDALLIWGYRDLSVSIPTLVDFAKSSNGIIELADFDQTQASDATQQSVFGVKWISEGDFVTGPIQFLKPQNASSNSYQQYKWFYHVPYNLTGFQDATTFQMDTGATIDCTGGKSGNFKFRNNNYRFWVCPDNKVYFDTDQPQNNAADTANVAGEKIPIGGYDFKLNYLESISEIRISFKPDYEFNDFLTIDNLHNKIFPFTNDKTKVVMSMGYWDLTRERPVAAAIVNKFQNSQTIWFANYARNAITLSDLHNLGDDYKQLLASLIFSVTNKRVSTTQQIGQTTSYINVNNTDILEMYRIDLSIGTPF